MDARFFFSFFLRFCRRHALLSVQFLTTSFRLSWPLMQINDQCVFPNSSEINFTGSATLLSYYSSYSSLSYDMKQYCALWYETVSIVPVHCVVQRCLGMQSLNFFLKFEPTSKAAGIIRVRHPWTHKAPKTDNVQFLELIPQDLINLTSCLYCAIRKVFWSSVVMCPLPSCGIAVNFWGASSWWASCSEQQFCDEHPVMLIPYVLGIALPS